MARLLVSLVQEDFGSPVYAFPDNHVFGSRESTQRYITKYGSVEGYEPKFLIIDSPDTTEQDAFQFFIENDGFVTDVGALMEETQMDLMVNNEITLFRESMLQYITVGG